MHKQSATRLRDENDILRRENETLMGPLIREKDEEIEKWKLENASLFERIAALESQNSELTIEVRVSGRKFKTFLSLKLRLLSKIGRFETSVGQNPGQKVSQKFLKVCGRTP